MREGKAMTTGITVRVDPDKCQGHARCSALAPELFELDEFGYARQALNSGVPPELVDKAYMARANCPEEAIIIESGAPQADP
jgi:ferredoxin